MRSPTLRLLGISLAALALGSCSYTYDLLAVVIGGRLAFIVDPSSDRKPNCIRSIDVSVDKGGPHAKPAKGDEELSVTNGGVYWQKTFNVGSYPNPFPVFYGAPLKGVPSRDVGSVEAKPLHVGVLYEVTAESSGSGYGGGWFRITEERRVENFPDDPTPAVLNEGGYDVTNYEAQSN